MSSPPLGKFHRHLLSRFKQLRIEHLKISKSKSLESIICCLALSVKSPPPCPIKTKSYRKQWQMRHKNREIFMRSCEQLFHRLYGIFIISRASRKAIDGERISSIFSSAPASLLWLAGIYV